MRLAVFVSTTLFVVLAVIVTRMLVVAPTELDLDRHPIREASSIELISLDPYQAQDEDPTRFHRWKILGSKIINDSTVRDDLLNSLSIAMKNHDDSVVQCFSPRHGMRSQVNGHTYEFVICFECKQGDWYIDGIEQTEYLLDATPTDFFNQVLSTRNVALPGSAPLLK